ncbi:MAG: hypothetical protein Q8P50_11220 [Bacillota bacterium]|nr:hypothetical protein [Bacillota bacterium]
MLDDRDKQVLRLTERVRSLEMLVFNLRVGRRVLMRLLEEQMRQNEAAARKRKAKPRRRLVGTPAISPARAHIIEFPKV